MSIEIRVSWGELIDKITILEIKRERLQNTEARLEVEKELELLKQARSTYADTPAGLLDLTMELKQVNESLWDIEDKIRDHERRKDFSMSFIELARSVYQLNDERAQLKRNLNIIMKSDIVEQKSYTPYE